MKRLLCQALVVRQAHHEGYPEQPVDLTLSLSKGEGVPQELA
jgi:hypothetical protein